MVEELRRLTPEDGRAIFEMIQEMGSGENGFENSLFSESYEVFKDKLLSNDRMSKGIDLDPKYVPQTIYWLYVDGRPVGYGKFRHYLNAHLRSHGGNIGYCIRPSEQGKGYGKVLLRELLKETEAHSLEKVLLTVNPDNWPSRKVVESNKGVLEKIENDTCFYWITLK